MKQKKINPLDITWLPEKYRGHFVALSLNKRRVLGKGRTAEEALKEAAKKGFKHPLLTKIPWENRSYLL